MGGILTFYTADLALEFLSSLAAFLVGFYALRGYFLTRNRTGLLFSWSFILMGAGILARLAFDRLASFEQIYSPAFTPTSLPIQHLALLFASVFLAASGYILLMTLFFKVMTKKIPLLLMALTGFLAFFSLDTYPMVNVIPAVLLSVMLLHAAENFWRKKTPNTLLVLVAFAILFLSEVAFLLIFTSMGFYLFGNALRLMAFLLLLANVLLVLRK